MNNEFYKEIIRLGFCLFVWFSYVHSVTLSLFWGYFFQKNTTIIFKFFFSIHWLLSLSFFSSIGKTNLYFFSFYHFSLSIKKKYGGEMLLWILFMDRCLPVLHGIRFTFVVVEEQFFFSKIKIFFFLFQTKNNHNNFFFFSFHTHPHTLTPSHTSITHPLFS